MEKLLDSFHLKTSHYITLDYKYTDVQWVKKSSELAS